MRYDFFIRARSDLYYFFPVNSWLTADTTAVQTGAGLGCTPTDHWASMPRHLAPLYASAGQVTYDISMTPALFVSLAHMCHCPSPGSIWPECFISGWLVLRGVAIKQVCDHEYELWRHTHQYPNGTLSDFWGNVLLRPLVVPGVKPWPTPTSCSGVSNQTV